MAENKKNIMTYEGLKALEDELQDLKVNRRREVALEDQGSQRTGRLVRERRVRCCQRGAAGY